MLLLIACYPRHHEMSIYTCIYIYIWYVYVYISCVYIYIYVICAGTGFCLCHLCKFQLPANCWKSTLSQHFSPVPIVLLVEIPSHGRIMVAQIHPPVSSHVAIGNPFELGGFNRKITYKQCSFHCHVWLLEGKSHFLCINHNVLHYRSINPPMFMVLIWLQPEHIAHITQGESACDYSRWLVQVS